MTSDEIQALVDRGFETGLKPAQGTWLRTERNCGCGMGACGVALEGVEAFDQILESSLRIHEWLSWRLGKSEDWVVGFTVGFDLEPIDTFRPDLATKSEDYRDGFREGEKAHLRWKPVPWRELEEVSP